MLYGVDVHDGYQKGLSFPTLVRQGYTFATVKLTQGTTYVRTQADEWIRAARAAGLIAGAYHWLNSSDGAAQARWFYKCLAAAGGPDGLLIQLDCEDDGYGPQMTAWANEWNRLTNGHPFIIYSGAWWWPRTNGFNGSKLTPYLWHAQYLSADDNTVPDDPAAFAARIPPSWWAPGYGGWSRATLLQFTSRGDAGGLGNNVDLNATPLTREQLLALTRPGGTQEDMNTEQNNKLNEIWATVRAGIGLGADEFNGLPWLSEHQATYLVAKLDTIDKAIAALSAEGGGTVELTDEQLTAIADRVAAKLQGLTYIATPPA